MKLQKSIRLATKMNQRSMIRLLASQFGFNGRFCGAEVGVYEGKLTTVLLTAFPHLQLTLVDPWRAGVAAPREIRGDDWLEFDQYRWDEIYKGVLDSIGPATPRCRVMRMLSEQAAMQIEDKSLDFVFIDADHTYESVKQDIELWLPKAKSIICGHDYGGKNDRMGAWGVKRAVNEAFGDRVEVCAGLVWAVHL